jgi:DNA-binding transcriptional MerR regulator
MEKEKSNNQNKISNQGYVIVPNYFLREWVKVLGGGPALLYLELLSYCHKEKDIVWPTLESLSKKMQLTPKTITKYQQILVKFGLIKKLNKRKTASGNYRRNIYLITPLNREKNTLPLGKIFPYLEEKFTPNLGKNLPINNNNIEHYQYNNKGVVAVVNFIKLKEEERRKRIKEDLTGLGFKASFREKLLKDFPLDKIEEKLELLKEKKHIINPSGWLMAALKNDYQGSQEEEIQEIIEEKKEEPQRKISSREEALRQIRLAKEKLALITPYYQIKEKEEKGGLPLGT